MNTQKHRESVRTVVTCAARTAHARKLVQSAALQLAGSPFGAAMALGLAQEEK